MKIKLFILTLSITINLSCVENVITIHILPDGQTFLQIVSTGDSIDIIDGDFQHPMYKDQSSSYELIKSDSIWKAITKIILRDSIFTLKPEHGLSYEFKIQKSETPISNIHKFKMNFIGREIKTEYPLLYKAIKSNNLDNKLLIISGPVTNNVSAYKQSIDKFSIPNSDFLNIYNSTNHVNVFAKIINRINND